MGKGDDMPYLIAVASSDEIHVDQSFGGAEGFYIYSVEGTEYKKAEYRRFDSSDIDIQAKAEKELSCQEKSCSDRQGGGCGNGNGCGLGGALPKVELIGDCRSLVCKKIGFQATKQLEKKHITSFDVECNIDEALSKIASYFNKIDNHQSLRKI